MNTAQLFPKMLDVKQNFPSSPRLEFRSLLEKQFQQSGTLKKLTPGMRVAVGVGSRGITNLKEIVDAVIGILRAAETKPFIVPAMGSHGGATPEGQLKVLSVYGITPESMGVPFDARMDVREIGENASGVKVLFSEAALEADAIVLVNRIKPHTDFRGNLGSGIQKMLVIGLGKHKGAANVHAAAAHMGHERVLRESAQLIAKKTRFLAGVAILEDQHHQTAELEVVDSKDLSREDALLVKARSMMPLLPFDQIDLLIVDQIGKEISGAGMDPNVTGRDVDGYLTSLQPGNGFKPQIFRIFLRDLTAATNGNGVGIGMADFTTTRAVKTLNLRYTYINGLTSLGLQAIKLPIYFDTDREVLGHAIASLALDPLQAPRVVHISNTLNLEYLRVSESMAEEMREKPGLTVTGEARELSFDSQDNLLPLPASYPNAARI